MNSDKTKEEILLGHSGNQIYNDGVVYDGATDSIYDAMDEYAKQVGIKFAEWIDGEMYECFLMTDEGEKFWHDVHGKETYPTEQLYSQFIENKKTKII